jgi:hypothetical protein
LEEVALSRIHPNQRMENIEATTGGTMQIDEHLIKISGGYIPISPTQIPQMDEDVELRVMGSVTKIEDKSNYDGTVNRIYHVKGVEVENYEN